MNIPASSELTVSAQSLSRNFGATLAVREVSLQLRRGEVLGLLGPNGAGKTTTMRMLTGNLAPTRGEVSICGIDLMDRPTAAKARIGYLPEIPPLYKDLKVDEYLRLAGRLHKVPKNALAKAVAKSKSRCGLDDMSSRLIGSLSKGYQQRVGIAQAIIHDPDVIILDEPTIGLDPNQIRTVRDLIKNLAEKRTVLISTHILPEVEMMCSRVVVIHKGEIRATDTAENLRKNHRAVGELLLEARAGADAAEALSKVFGVKDVTSYANGDWTHFTLRLDAKAEPGLDIMRLAAERKWDVREMHQKRATLEDVFAELTTADH